MTESTCLSPCAPAREEREHLLREFERARPSLERYARRRFQSQAEDLVQETWLAAQARYASFGGTCSLHTWFLAILRKKVVDLYRRESRTRCLPNSSEADAAVELACHEQTPDERAVGAELEATIDGWARKLEPESQALLRMMLGSVPGRRAAAELGIAEGALRTRAHRLRTQLGRELMARLGPDSIAALVSRCA